MADDTDLEELSKRELKERLRDADEPVSGTKAELIERLQDVDSDDKNHGERDADSSTDAPVAPGAWTDHLDRVRTTVQQLTSHAVDSFVGVNPLDGGDGWSYTVQLTEARRVPATADLVALYRVDVRPDGELVALEQVGRGRRDQVTPS